MTGKGKENLDKDKQSPDLGSEKKELSSLKNRLEKKDDNTGKEELSSLKKEVKEKQLVGVEKKNLSSLKAEIKEKKTVFSDKNEAYKIGENTDSSGNGFLSKQVSVFSSWEKNNPSRPLEGIKSSYMDVVQQIDDGLKNPNIIARGLAKIIKFIVKNEK